MCVNYHPSFRLARASCIQFSNSEVRGPFSWSPGLFNVPLASV